MTETSGYPSASAAHVDEVAEQENSRIAENGTITRKSNTLLYVLLAGLILLAVAGLALLGAYFYLSRQQTAPVAWASPLDLVHADKVAPDLAVLALAGEPDDRVIRAALDASELETANAGLVYSVLLPDAPRGGQWLLLANRYAGKPDAGGKGKALDPVRATQAYQTALDQAALSPGLGDVTRAGMSLQVARGLAALGQEPIARLALKQAENIARYSLTLLPSQRRDTLEQVVAGYRGIGDRQAANALEAQVSRASAGPGIKLPPTADLLAGLRGSVVLAPALTSAIVARQQAAATLAARWLASSSGARTELATALGDALKDEDAARTDFYAEMGNLASADQLAMLHDRIAWLSLKYRVARKAFGVSLVPEWEGQAEDIATDLSAAYTDLINGYGRQLDTLDPGDAAVGRLQLLQQALLWSRLGLFPDHAEDTLRTQLVDAARQLWTRRGGAGLVIVLQENGSQHFYLLSGSNSTQGTQPTATN